MRKMMFVACEKLIIDNSGLASIITVMQDVNVQIINPDEGPPADAIAPKEWALACMWRLDAEELYADFVQHFEVSWPNGQKFSNSSVPFKTGPSKYVFNYLNAIGFPIGQVGTINFRSWVEKEGKTVSSVEEYFAEVKHIAQAQPA